MTYIKYSVLFLLTFILCYFLLLSPLALDFTDEGLYLLETGGLNSEAYWFVPYGQILKPIFSVCGYNIGIYRTVTFTLLVFLHIILFINISKINFNKISLYYFPIIFLTFFIFNFLNIRTAGYNYLNYLSLLLFSIALLNKKGLFNLINFTLIILAFNISLDVKPTTSLFILITTTLWIYYNYNSFKHQISHSWIYLSTITAIITVVFLPAHIMQYQMIVIGEYKTTFLKTQQLGALSHLNGLFLYFRNTLGVIYHFPVVSILFITGTIYSIVRKKLTVFALSSLGFLLFFKLYFLFINKDISYQMQSINLVFLCLIFFVFVYKNIQYKLYLYVFILPFVYAFGSGNGFLQMVPQAFAIPIILLTAKNLNYLNKKTPLIIGGVILLVLNYVNWLNTPYRTSTFWNSNTHIVERSHNTVIYLEKSQAKIISDLYLNLTKNGWKTGSYLFALNNQWSTTIPYILGAHVPNTAMTTLFGYENADVVGLKKLQRQVTPKSFWIMYSTSSDSLYNKQKSILIDTLLSQNNKSLEKDFKLVYDKNELIVYKPNH